MARTTVPKETRVTKTVTHDRLAVAAKFPSGGSFRFAFNRGGESLTWGGSADAKAARAEMATFMAWVKHRAGETNGSVIDRLEALAKTCNTCGELIAKMA